MGYDTGLADRLRRKGVRVVEVAGWKSRGSSTYSPQLAIWHHTAGGARGATPSLAVCTYGRGKPGTKGYLPGPLCQVLQSREPDGNDIAYVIAAGRANHAGTGSYAGISGNSKAAGVEVEHIGTTSVDVRRHEVTARILAALLEGPGGSRNPRLVVRHASYATPPGRKVDFALTSPWTEQTMRNRVAHWLGRTTTTASPAQTVPEDDMFSDTDRRDIQVTKTAVGRLEIAVANLAASVASNRDEPSRIVQVVGEDEWWLLSEAGRSHISDRKGADLLVFSKLAVWDFENSRPIPIAAADRQMVHGVARIDDEPDAPAEPPAES